MLPAPFYSDLPTDLGDDSVWSVQAPADESASARSPAPLKAWITQATNTLNQALGCFVWGYSTWS